MTGGASGIGAAAALAAKGCRVVAADINFAGAQAVTAEIAKSGHRARALELDVRDHGALNMCVADIVAGEKRIDILVTAAGLYFTFAARQPRGSELEHYYEYKRLVTDTIMRLGGTLSHHHAVGIEHRPWMTQEVSPAGLQALHALKTSLDPKHVLNPGKLLPEPGATKRGEHTGDYRPPLSMIAR